MTWSVDPLVKTRAGAVCAITERACHLSSVGPMFAGRGDKRPVIILVIKDGEIVLRDMAGRTIETEEIERRYPGALDAILHPD